MGKQSPHIMPERLELACFSEHESVLLLTVNEGDGGMVSSFNTVRARSSAAGVDTWIQARTKSTGIGDRRESDFVGA